MLTVKVILADGNSWVTSFHGTVNEVINYYLGKLWNPGMAGSMSKCIQVEISA